MDNSVPPTPKNSKDCPSHEKATFDRLKPRNSTSELKRKASSSPSQTNEDCGDAKVRKTEFKREYSKLRKLVPALNARNDITKVEIIEETIRYIDALHHQLAARLQNSQSSSDGHQNESKQKGKPLRSLEGSSMQNLRNDSSESQLSDNQTHSLSNSRLNDTNLSASTSTSVNNSPSVSTIGTSVTEESSPETSVKDLKAAVENIQKMFSIHLMESQLDNDET